MSHELDLQITLKRLELAITDYVMKQVSKLIGETIQGGKLQLSLTSGILPASSIPATAVTPGSYGDATHVGQFTVESDGRLTAAASVAITGAGQVVTVVAEFDDGGGVLASQTKELYTDFGLTIQGVTLWAPHEAGSATVDVLTGVYSALPSISSITGGAPAALSAAQKAQPSVSAWSPAVAAGTGWQLSLSGVTSLTKLVVAFNCVRS